MAAKRNKVVIQLAVDKQTKNKQRFSEVSDDKQVIGKLYMDKEVFESMGKPKSITATLEPE